MKSKQLENKINKAKITPDGYRLVPYPHQDNGEFYPEWKKYGKAFEDITDEDTRYAADCARAYNRFVEYMKSEEIKIKKKLIEEVNELPTHELITHGDVSKELVHKEDILKLLN